MPRRLSWKLILSLTVIVVLVRGFYGLYAVRTEKRRLMDMMVLGADQLSRSITSATWHSMLADQRSSAYETMSVIAEKQGVDRIRMFNREGRLMFSTRPAEREAHANLSSEVCSACHQGGGRLESLSAGSRVRFGTNPEGGRTLNMVTPIYNERACSQAPCHAHPTSIKVLGVLDVALRLDSVERDSEGYRLQVLGLTLFEVVVIALFIVLFVRRFVSRPIQELIEGTKSVAAMQLDQPIRIRHGSQELDELSASFNTMRERLAGALDRINQFTQELEAKVADRTEQLKAAHKKLLVADRLASLGQLSASVAHEINNPIAAVLNLSMLMQRIMKDHGIPAGREAEFRKYLGQVVSETSRVGRIVSDLLAFSRRSKPQRTEADLNKLVVRTLALVDHKMKLSDTTVEMKLDADLPQLLCDSSQMQQVVLNLVLNAAEATQPRGHGRILVSTRRSADGKAVELAVEDNGEGIPPENLRKIFDPFFTTKPEGKGVGLGLAVVYGIVQGHGGEVDAASAPGEGTRFTVSLPLESGPRPEGSAPADAPGAGVAR